MAAPEPDRDGRSRQRSPTGLFYDRLIPLLLAGLGLVLAAVILLSLAAMLGLFHAG